MPRILIPLALGVVGIAVIVGLVTLTPRPAPPSGGPVAARLGFGKIPALSGEEASGDAVSALAAGGRAAEEAARATGAPAPAVARDMAAPGIMAGGGTAGSAGIAVAEPGVTEPGIGIRPVPPEEYLPPRVVYTWEGTTLPEIPAELAVFRTASRGFTDAARTIASGIGLRLPGELRLMNVSLRGGADGKTVFSFDGTGGMFSWYRERDWAEVPATEAAPTVSDADAIAAANAYLRDLGIDLARYGAPSVIRFDDPCGRGMPCILMEGRTAPDAPVSSVAAKPAVDVAPTIWPGPGYWPSVTVRYPVLLDGRPTLEWDGTDGGAITVQVSARDRSAESGTVLMVDGLERSLYPTQSIASIRETALRGGINPWGGWDGGIYTPEEEVKRPVVRIRLTEARLGYLQKYSATDGTPTSYFIPVVAFRGTVTDQFGNSYPHAVIVSALDPEAFAVEEPQPVPLGKPVPMTAPVEAAPPPSR